MADDAVRALRALPRHEAEVIYQRAFEADDKVALRWLAQNDRYFLLTCILGKHYVRHDWAFARIREVEAEPDGVIDLWARGHLKTSAITYAGNIQDIICDPEITICIFSHIASIAKSFLRQIKIEFETNRLLKRLFSDVLWTNPDRDAPRWSEDNGIVVKRKSNPREATVQASGLVDGMPTGMHFMKRVYDDVVTEKSVTTPDMIRKTTEMFELSEYLGIPGGRVQIVGTRYHFGDTYGKLLRRGWKERRHPATHNGKFDGIPVFLTQAEWDKELAKPKSITAAQMLLNPLEGAETKFDLRAIQYWEVRPKRLNVYITVDPSKGRWATSDSTAIVVTGMDVNRNKYLLDGWCHRMTLSRRWQVLRDAHRRWSKTPGVQFVAVGYEQFGLQVDTEYFEERMRHEDCQFPILELTWPRQGRQSKEQRIERLEPDVRMGRWRLPKVIRVDDEGNVFPYDASQTKAAQAAIAAREAWRVAKPIHKMDEDGKLYDFLMKFIDEFIFFPAAQHDDILDAGSRIYDMDPQPPLSYDDEPGSDRSVEPPVYVDGV